MKQSCAKQRIMAQDIIVAIPLEQLKKELSDTVRSEFEKYIKGINPQKAEVEYLSRKQAAALLQISLPTLSKWTLEGLLTGYRISSRIRYKRSEVEESLNSIKTLKIKK